MGILTGGSPFTHAFGLGTPVDRDGTAVAVGDTVILEAGECAQVLVGRTGEITDVRNDLPGTWSFTVNVDRGPGLPNRYVAQWVTSRTVRKVAPATTTADVGKDGKL